MKTKALENTQLLNESLKSGVFATIFVFLSNVGGIKALFEEQLKIYLFPFAAITETITTLLAFTGFITAKNRNLGKTFDLTLSLLTTTLVLYAVIGGLWFGFTPIAVSSLFLAAIGSGALYNVGQFFYHAYRWLSRPSTPENNALKATYRNQTIKYGIASLIGLTLVAGIITTLILPLMLPVIAPIVLVVGGISAATALAIGLIYRIYKAFNPTVVSNQLHQVNIEENNHVGYQRLNNDNTSETEQVFDYYNIQPAVTDKETLLIQIQAKKASLRSQIEQSQGTISEQLWPQETKRNNKLDYLNQIEASLANPTGENANWTMKPKVFQSFFKDVGEIERITNAAKPVLQNLLEESTLEESSESTDETMRALRKQCEVEEPAIGVR